MHPPFVLGTAQLGMDYGITNAAGAPSRDRAFAILDTAWDAGVRCFDTARAYGRSEEIIGAWISASGNVPDLVTKVPSLENGVHALRRHLQNSFTALRVSKVRAVLLHNAKDYRANEVRDVLSELHDEGLTDMVGVSAYSINELPIDAVTKAAQLPVHVFAQEAAKSAQLKAFVLQGGRLFIRSVLVQGLLVAEEADMPKGFEIQKRAVRAFRQIASDASISATALAIQCARRLVPGAQLVLGADSVHQVHSLAEAARAQENADAVAAALALGETWDSDLFDPRAWPSR